MLNLEPCQIVNIITQISLKDLGEQDITLMLFMMRDVAVGEESDRILDAIHACADAGVDVEYFESTNIKNMTSKDGKYTINLRSPELPKIIIWIYDAEGHAVAHAIFQADEPAFKAGRWLDFINII